MEQLTHFIRGLTTHTRMLLDASVGETLSTKTDDEVKTLIDNVCQNKYGSSKQDVKEKNSVEIKSQIALISQIDMLKKQLTTA